MVRTGGARLGWSNASTRWQPRIGVLGLLVAMCLVVACPPASAATDADYARVQVEEVGISLLVPEHWEPTRLTRKTAKRLLARNRDFREAGITVDALLATPFAARSDADADGYPERWMSVYVEGVDKLFLEPWGWKAGLEAAGLEDARVGRTKVNGIPMLHSTATATATRDDGTPFTAYVTQYAFANGDDDVISIGFFRLRSDDAEFEAMTDTMIRSLKLR